MHQIPVWSTYPPHPEAKDDYPAKKEITAIVITVIVFAVVAGILTSFITLISKPLYAEVVLLAAFILILWQRGGKTA